MIFDTVIGCLILIVLVFIWYKLHTFNNKKEKLD